MISGRLFDRISSASACFTPNGTGLKSVLLPFESELWARPELDHYRKRFEGERLGWKLSTLSSVGPDYAAVKIVGANALNRYLGRPRSMSTIALFDKVTFAPICLLDGTEISAARTATYATTIVDRFLSGRHGLSVFIPLLARLREPLQT